MQSILKKLKIAIITGGWSGERHENIGVARNMERILVSNGVKPTMIVLDNSFDILPQLENLDIDFAFISVTEEVPIQPFLDALGIPYNGSSNLATSLSINKKFIKIILQANNITCPRDILIEKDKPFSKTKVFYPCVVKPLRSGSSCGVSLVKDKKGLNDAIEIAFKQDSKVLIEEYIDGQEITIPVLGDFVMPSVKITSESGIWDEERKSNLDVTFEAIKLNKNKLNRIIQKTVNQIRDIFELESFWRIDAIYKNDSLYILEINTQPHLPGGVTGMFPASCGVLGWTHFDFLTKIAEEVLKRKKTSYKHTIKIVD